VVSSPAAPDCRRSLKPASRSPCRQGFCANLARARIAQTARHLRLKLLHGLSERLIFRIAGDDPPSFRSRYASSLRFVARILAELGGMIVEYANVFATAKLFVPIIVIAIVGVVLTELVMWLERRMSRWRQLERERF
jgi:hypothetical protein